MDLVGKYLVVWLSREAIETFLGVPEPAHERTRHRHRDRRMPGWSCETAPGPWVRSAHAAPAAVLRKWRGHAQGGGEGGAADQRPRGPELALRGELVT